MSYTFPKELAELKQWVCWRLEPAKDEGKPKKIPYDAATGYKASSTNPKTWHTLREVEAAMKKYMYTGIGFVFTKESGFVGVDIDHCRDTSTGGLNEIAEAIVSKCQTYVEISPSGEGLHLFFKGVMPEGGNKNTPNGVEMYSTGRYFTMTGKRLEGSCDEVATDDGELEWIHKTYIQQSKTNKSTKRKKRSGSRAVALSDEEVIEKATSTDNGALFNSLWEGNWKETHQSQSEADMALCCKLAFWTGKNKEQMDRLFRQSKLFREKWDEKHHASGATYGEETLDKAIELVTQTYSSNGDMPVFEYEGRYFRSKGNGIYPLTNFVMEPIEMIVSEDETQISADLVTISGEVFRQTFLTTDFSNLQRFKNILNKRTLGLSYTGSEADLELLKGLISGLSWERKTGVKALGLYRHGGRWVYVSTDGAIEAGGVMVGDIVQLEKHKNIASGILATDIIKAKDLLVLGPLLLGYNESLKTVGVLAWCASCFLKEHLKHSKIKFPHLLLIGEAGSGKSNTLERVILPIFSRLKVAAANQVTAFTLMKDSSSSNVIPQPLDEFKPSKIDRNKLAVLYNHMRDSYDGHEGVRGRADQTSVTYELCAPLVIAGEESPDEPAIRERSIELLFSKKDLKIAEHKKNFKRLMSMSDELENLGRGLLDVALRTDIAEVNAWHRESLEAFDKELPSRIVSNLACCVVGLKLLERLSKQNALLWEQVFNIPLNECIQSLALGAKEYLLDGNTSNKGIIEQSLEVMARMGLQNEVEWILIEKETQLAIRLIEVYDKFTKYRREFATGGECLELSQFKKQLKNSDLFIDNKTVRFQNDTHKAYVLDFRLLKERCDVEGFINTGVKPLK
ncbi:MAG: bifunctional DNA primase/polymerase [Bacillota bacterium]